MYMWVFSLLSNQSVLPSSLEGNLETWSVTGQRAKTCRLAVCGRFTEVGRRNGRVVSIPACHSAMADVVVPL